MALMNTDVPSPDRAPTVWVDLTPKLMLSISTTDDAVTLLVRLRGELRSTSGDAFAHRMATELAERSVLRVILALDDLDYLDSAGATAIAKLATSISTRDGRLILLHPSRAMALVLDLFELSDCI